MKKLQLFALTMLFALVGVELSIDAADGCAKGWKKNKNHVCVKVSAKKIASNKANKATKKVIAKKFNAEQQALNAMNAYNAAIKASSQDSAAAQRSAMTSINNVIAMYNSYLTSVQSGAPVIFGGGVSQPISQPTSGAHTNIAVGEQNPASGSVTTASAAAYVSSCDDGSTATCYDGSEISGIDCGDGTTSDVNGMCSDGSLVTCSDGMSQPMCSDYTSPY